LGGIGTADFLRKRNYWLKYKESTRKGGGTVKKIWRRWCVGVVGTKKELEIRRELESRGSERRRTNKIQRTVQLNAGKNNIRINPWRTT